VRREWEPEELIACWTLVDDDWRLVSNKAGATRLGFSLILKYFELEGQFPRHASDVPRAAVKYVAGQVKVDPNEFTGYDWSGRSIERHRAQIRKALDRQPRQAGAPRASRRLQIATEVGEMNSSVSAAAWLLLRGVAVVRALPPT